MADFVIQTVLWFVFFWVAHRIIEGHIQTKIKAENELIKEIMNKTHIVKAENHGEMIYWFEVNNDSFVAQGKNMSELIQHCKLRYPPTHHFLIIEGEKVIFKVSAPDWMPVPVDLKT